MKKKYGMIILFIFSLVINLPAKIIYVNVAYGGVGVGDFWHRPLNNLAFAIEKAQAGDQIWVAKGVYNGPFVLKEGVDVYGGFAGTESDFSMRDPSSNQTVLNGDTRGRTLAQLYPFKVSAILDGFIITGGKTGLLGISSGAGAYISDGGVLRNCRITGNRITSSKGVGAGVYLNHGGVVEKCIIDSNEAAGSGGGVALSYAGMVDDCAIYDNKAVAGSGGGIYIDTLNDYPTKRIPLASIEKYNVFTAGDEGINTYRIPTMVVTRDGSILAFCEARKKSWRDHGNTAVVVKRSTDCGKTWSAMITVASDNYVGAYADPCPIVDSETGEVFVLMNYWRASSDHASKNTAWLARSKDDGVSWSVENVSSTMVASGCALQGVGVGSGIQMRGKDFQGRLIIPTRQIDKATGKINNRTVYSDDHGVTWQVGQPTQQGGEHEIAESPLGTLVLNQRSSARIVGRSTDGGQTWSELVADEALFFVTRGCQASILGDDTVLLFSGPKGGSYSDTIDDRCNLTLARSPDGGITWTGEQLLYRNGSGYSSLAALPDGRICILFESGDNYGFIRTAAARPTGWMRLDLLVLPKEVMDKEYWFAE